MLCRTRYLLRLPHGGPVAPVPEDGGLRYSTRDPGLIQSRFPGKFAKWETETDDLRGIVMITGCTQGLGRALAKDMLYQGWHVLMTGRNEAARKECEKIAEEAKEKLLRLQDKMASEKGLETDQLEGHIISADFMALDLSDKKSIHDCVDEFFGRYKGRQITLVNNAAVGVSGWDEEAFAESMETNMWGMVRLTDALYNGPPGEDGSPGQQAGIPSGSRVLFVTCRDSRLMPGLLSPHYCKELRFCGKQPYSYGLRHMRNNIKLRPDDADMLKLPTPAYTLSKACALTYARLCYKEFGKRGIKVNTVCPGRLPTRLGIGTVADFRDIAHRGDMPSPDGARASTAMNPDLDDNAINLRSIIEFDTSRCRTAKMYYERAFAEASGKGGIPPGKRALYPNGKLWIGMRQYDIFDDDGPLPQLSYSWETNAVTKGLSWDTQGLHGVHDEYNMTSSTRWDQRDKMWSDGKPLKLQAKLEPVVTMEELDGKAFRADMSRSVKDEYMAMGSEAVGSLSRATGVDLNAKAEQGKKMWRNFAEKVMAA